MSALRQDIEHYTPERAKLILEASLELVAALDPPEDLRVACFEKAAELLSAKTVQITQPGSPLLDGLRR